MLAEGDGVIGRGVPRTKLLRPEVAPDTVIDPDLLRGTARAVVATPVTLIAAQAGAGKTTLASAAVESSGLPVAWVSLDAGDDDLASLLHLVASAVETAVPGACPAVRELLRTDLAAGGDPRRAAGVLVNDVLAADPPLFALVLDDAHVVADPAAVALVDTLLAHAPPALRVVLTARTDTVLSLSRLRATGRLAEVRGDDLRLGVAQAEQVLNGRLRLDVAPERVAAIVEAVGGWATGVHLLARSVDRGTVRTPAADPGAGADPALLYDYLADEVLASEAPEVVAFLLDTCVLGTLTPAAAQEVSGRPDAHAVLVDLNRRLHFLVLAIDRAAGLYRYHDLFASFLRRRLATADPDGLARQHLRAATVADEPGTRIEHLLAAADWDAAADAIEAAGRAAIPSPAEVARVAAWAERVPVRRPWLDLVQGVAAAGRGDRVGAVEHLERVLAAGEDVDDLLGRWLALRTLHLCTNDHARLVPELARLAAQPEFRALAPGVRVDHEIGSAYGCMYSERWEEAGAHLFAALDLAMATGDASARDVLAEHLSPLLTAVDGGLDRVEGYAAWAVGRTTGEGPSVARLGAHHQRAVVSLLRGRLADAVDASARGRVILDRLGGSPYLRVTFDWVDATAARAGGDLAQAEALLRRRCEEVPATDLDAAMNTVQRPFWAGVLRAQGRADEVAAVATHPLGDPLGPMSAAIVDLLTLVLAAEVAWAAGDLDAALAAAARAAPIEARVRFVPFVVSPRITAALVHEERGETVAADRELGAALATAEERGTPGLLLSAGPPLVPLLVRARARGVAVATTTAALDALGSSPRTSPVPLPGSPEVLSRREVDVLRLLVEGASNRQVADALLISEHTVKTHVRHLMAKLGARSRSHAAALARAGHLV